MYYKNCFENGYLAVFLEVTRRCVPCVDFFVLFAWFVDKCCMFFVGKLVRGKAVCIYPKTTSSVIISAKPMAKPMVDKLEWLPSEASGISSSTTT